MPVPKYFEKDHLKYLYLVLSFFLGLGIIIAAYYLSRPTEKVVTSQNAEAGEKVGSVDEECRKFEFDRGVAKWEVQGDEFKPTGDPKGTLVTGKPTDLKWSVGSSNADGIVVKAGTTIHYPQVGDEGEINQDQPSVSHITFCLYETTSECGDEDYVPQEGECKYITGDTQSCNPPYDGECKYCSKECKEITIKGGYCGDSIINGAETCDDGNQIDTDSCKNDCTKPVVNNPVCGDEDYLPKTGECKYLPGDPQTCVPQYNSQCQYCNKLCRPVIIQGSYCGDGITNEPNEECDDGNQNDSDECKNNCTRPETVLNSQPECRSLTYRADKEPVNGSYLPDTLFSFTCQGYDPDTDDSIAAYQFSIRDQTTNTEVLNVICGANAVPSSLVCPTTSSCANLRCEPITNENRLFYSTVSGFKFPGSGNYQIRSRIQDTRGMWSNYAVE